MNTHSSEEPKLQDLKMPSTREKREEDDKDPGVYETIPGSNAQSKFMFKTIFGTKHFHTQALFAT